MSENGWNQRSCKDRFQSMTYDPATLYRAHAARDARFDGIFFTGVTSTGIYCRPVCTARTPKAANCRFFPSAAAAERAAFRPCLRCRPELAPGLAPVDGARRVASRLVHRITEGLIAEGGVDALAAEFFMSARQLRRIVRRELGVSPIELVLTRRLLLAKQLLTETKLPVIQVAYASGFASLRRFNDAFLGRYGMPPTRLRRSAAGATARASAFAPSDADRTADTLRLQLAYRPPYDWAALLAFLRGRTLAGAEIVDADSMARTVRIGGAEGWIRVSHTPARHALVVELAHTLTPVLPTLLARLRHLFDLGGRPDLIAAHLGQDPRLAGLVAARPGLRVPGGFDGFELGVRAILGQQVTVKGATTLAGRFVDAFGTPIRTPLPSLTRLAPTAARVAAATEADIASLGIVRTRARSILALAERVGSGELNLAPGAEPDTTMAQLTRIPGIGPWTARYIALRALGWPDAFPAEDLALRKRLGGVSAREAERISQAWRPWRSYATLHLWHG
jgi:AraC family transcriptional regulator, regulatory protein of adaptative response / DNA-3-methyladenine glycosylase II